MKKILLPICAALLLFSCNKTITTSDLGDAFTEQQPEKMSMQQLDETIKTTVLATGNFNWNQASALVVYSALQYDDDVLSIGYKPAGQPSDLSSTIHQINIEDPAWIQAKTALLQQVLQYEKLTRPGITINDLIAYNETTLPVINVHVSNINTIHMLRNNNLVRYAEPIGYEPINSGLFVENNPINLASSSGCGSNTAEAGLVANTDYSTISPNAKQSWNYAYHNIPAAWARSTGSGKKVMIIDTGLSPDQALFSSLLNTGQSSGRTVEKKVTLRKSAWFGLSYGSVETSTADGCGHGTSMAGALASPRGTAGGTVGVAYNASLVTVRASVDVMIDESREAKGVSDAFVLAGNTSSVNIVSMSMGRITSSSQIEDAVNYAYNKGKLIFCAAGTSFGWSAGWWGVIFPATLSKVNAVTGIQDNLKSRCDACHEGSEVDFVVVMEKANNGKTALSTAQSGIAPSTVGGSSVATATAAGIAALVWSRNPSYSRQQVIDKMAQSSSYYPNKNSNFGWGIINADYATN